MQSLKEKPVETTQVSGKSSKDLRGLWSKLFWTPRYKERVFVFHLKRYGSIIGQAASNVYLVQLDGNKSEHFIMHREMRPLERKSYRN